MAQSNIYFALVIVTVFSWNTCPALSSSFHVTSNHIDHNGIVSGSKYLDNEKKYFVTWKINTEKEIIFFEVTAKTKGYVGFGISPSGGMTGADILIAGVYQDGTVYFSDRHGVGNSEPVEDKLANWIVTSGKETGDYTKLQFRRQLNTCDDHDMPITEGTMRIIWALGETDTITYHGATAKGTKSINFYLSNEENKFKQEDYKHLDITSTFEMPEEKTTYWCTIHKAPLFAEKQHIVAIEPVLESALALQHTHHFTVFRCIVTDDQDPDKIFEPWISYPGDHCFDQSNSSFPFAQYCNGNVLYVWSKGGNSFVLSPELGLPMPETPGRREYYAIEIHYDNPEKVKHKTFETGARIFYTPNLREKELGLLVVGQEFQVQLTVPPQTKDFLVAGHCSSKCTQEFLPEDGITIFRNQFHAHLAGRKMKLRHFRGNEELPWLDVEEYFDFDFQQNKPFTHYRKVEKGDQITVECTYDSTKSEGGRAVIGGLRTQDEMCQSILYYYPRQKMFYCASGQNLDAHFKLLGVTKYEKRHSSFPGGIPEYDILEPKRLAGAYLESVSFKVDWTQEFRERFQREKVYGDQVGFCVGEGGQYLTGDVKYPTNLKVYAAPNDCSGGRIVNPSILTLTLMVAVIFGNFQLQMRK